MSFKSWLENGSSVSYDKLSMKPIYEDHIKKEPTGFEIEIDESKARYAVYDRGHNFFIRLSTILYKVAAVLFCIALVAVMLLTVSNLPPTGNPENPANNNEVPERYIEKGMEETGAVNIVAGMILDYRAFDTLGESHVLFIASVTVLILMRKDKKKNAAGTALPPDVRPAEDPILQVVAKVLVPVIMIFGIYVVLNGHLSPGGGFSGGAIIGAGLILYLNAFGFEKTERFFTEKLYKRVTLYALAFYALAKCYSFFCGANHLDSHIPQGTPGHILSAGLILPLDIAVGCVVACTMYAFYVHFRKGGF